MNPGNEERLSLLANAIALFSLLISFLPHLQEDTYFTVHVTPQEGCSYVSFETNLEQDSYTSLINQVIAIFRPERCTVSLFANKVGLWQPSSYPGLLTLEFVLMWGNNTW